MQPHKFLSYFNCTASQLPANSSQPAVLQQTQPLNCWLNVSTSRRPKRAIEVTWSTIFFPPYTSTSQVELSQSAYHLSAYVLHISTLNHHIPSPGILLSALVKKSKSLSLSKPGPNSTSREPSLINRMPAHMLPRAFLLRVWSVEQG